VVGGSEGDRPNIQRSTRNGQRESKEQGAGSSHEAEEIRGQRTEDRGQRRAR
jgi:hypothetical protein